MASNLRERADPALPRRAYPHGHLRPTYVPSVILLGTFLAPITFTTSTSTNGCSTGRCPCRPLGAVRNLVNYYEERDDSVLRLLGQEERVPAFRSVTDAGRVPHYE